HYAVAGIFAQAARGVGIQHLGGSRFANLPFPLPPLDEQGRIAEAVGRRLLELREAEAALISALRRIEEQDREILAAAIAGELVNSEAALAESERRPPDFRPDMTKSLASNEVHESLFVKVGRSKDMEVEADQRPLPLGWEWVRIDQIGEVTLGRQRSPEHHQGPHMRPYLRVANVLEDRIDTSDVFEMNFTPDEYQVYRLQDGDILLNEGQSPELVGRPAMYRGEVPGSCFQNTLIRFRASALVDPGYALIVFRHYMHAGEFQRVARWSTNIAHLGLERFRAMPFTLPPINEQQRIAAEARDRLEQSWAQKVAIRSSLSRIPEMERELLAAAVSGQFMSQNEKDESAIALLERLGPPLRKDLENSLL